MSCPIEDRTLSWPEHTADTTCCWRLLVLDTVRLNHQRMGYKSNTVTSRPLNLLNMLNTLSFCIDNSVLVDSNTDSSPYNRAASCPEIPDIPEILTLSWNCPEILFICPDIVLCYAVVTALPLSCTWLHHNWTLLLLVLLAYLLTYYSFALVGSFYSRCFQQFATFFYRSWSAWLIKICEHSTFLCLGTSWNGQNHEKCPEIVLKFTKKLVLKFHFLLLGALL